MSQTRRKDDSDSVPETPVWVKVFGAALIVFVLLVVILHLTGHSPRSHMPQAQQRVHQH